MSTGASCPPSGAVTGALPYCDSITTVKESKHTRGMKRKRRGGSVDGGCGKAQGRGKGAAGKKKMKPYLGAESVCAGASTAVRIMLKALRVGK